MNFEFELSESDIQLSKKLYNNVIIRVIIPNGYGVDLKYDKVGKNISILFPEKNLSFEECISYIENLVYKNSLMGINNITIFTHSVSIITSFPRCLVRIVDRSNKELVLPKEETFAQNQMHFIIDESKASIPTIPTKFINSLIKRINSKKHEKDEKEREEIISDIELVGEELIYLKLNEMMGINKRRNY